MGTRKTFPMTVSIEGICTLNTVVPVGTVQIAKDLFSVLTQTKALLICGDADEVVPPCATSAVCDMLPMRDKRHLVLPGGNHDLSSFKERLVPEMALFVTQE